MPDWSGGTNGHRVTDSKIDLEIVCRFMVAAPRMQSQRVEVAEVIVGEK